MGIELALAFTLRKDIEGGYVNNLKDPGGETNLGVTQKTYSAYCKEHNIPQKNMKDLTVEDVTPIYKEKYWDECGCDLLDPKFAVCVFDAAVNCGPSRAIRWKQLTINPEEYNELRINYYLELIKKRPSLEIFKKGWLRRVDKLEGYLNGL